MKKEYTPPTFSIIELELTDIICTSGPLGLTNPNLKNLGEKRTDEMTEIEE